MNATMTNRKAAAQLIEQALPVGQTLRYQNLGQDNILSAYLPAFKNNRNTRAEVLKVEQALARILAWDSVQDGSIDYDFGNASIAIIFH